MTPKRIKSSPWLPAQANIARLKKLNTELMAALEGAIPRLREIAIPGCWPALDKCIASARATIAKARGE